MVQKKKRKKKKKAANKGIKLKFLMALAIVFFVVFTLAAAYYMISLRRPETPVSGPDTASLDHPPFEDHPRIPPVIEPSRKKKRFQKNGKPMLAIVIDDMGYRRDEGEDLLALDLELTFAFLPAGPFSLEQAEEADRRGRDILLHFPMEPSDPTVNPGPGAAKIAMRPSELGRVFRENMAAVPMAIGINNHMGSRFTRDEKSMREFLGLVKNTGLFYLDSYTVSDSTGYELAGDMGIRRARRNVFLDNVQDRDLIRKQLEQLIIFSEKYGKAIGIGHPYPETVAALDGFESRLNGRAVLVRVSDLVD